MKKNTIYRIKVLKWNEHNKSRKKTYKKTMIANNFCDDAKINALPLACRWLFLGVLLRCGDIGNEVITMTERQINGLLTTRLGSTNALGLLQSLQLVAYEIVPNHVILNEKKEMKGKKRKEMKGKEEPSVLTPEEKQLALDEALREDSLSTELTPSPISSTHRILEIWNTHCGSLSKAKGLNTTRKKQAEAKWKENPKEEYWIEVVKRMAASNFCTGKNDRGWVASFDWLLRGDTPLKVLEGKYDNRTTAASTAQTRKYDKLDELEKQWEAKGAKT